MRIRVANILLTLWVGMGQTSCGSDPCEVGTAWISTEGETLVLDDEFVDNRGEWAQGDSENRRLELRDGRYHIEHKRLRTPWLTWTTVAIPRGRDFLIETEIHKISGIINHGYGLMFGAAGVNDNYTFLVSGDGHYRFGIRTAGAFADLTGWQPFHGVNQGNGVSNRLAVSYSCGNFILEVNEAVTEVIEMSAQWGPFVGFEINSEQEVQVEYLRVHVRPPE